MLNIWTHTDDLFRATTISGPNGGYYHLTVEMLPNRDWEWVAWRAGAPGEEARGGVAESWEDAAATAERAATGLATA